MDELTAQIEAAALATPGVLSLYRTGSAVTNLIEAGVERLSRGDAAPARVSITGATDAPAVELSLGIAATAGAPETTALVRAQVERVLIAHGVVDPLIRLTVVHVADGVTPSAVA